MFGSSAIFRGLGSIPNFSVTRLAPSRSSVFSTYPLRRQEPVMWTNALRDYADPPKPPFTKSPFGNMTRSIVPYQVAGAKRKLDMAYPSESTLGSLHSGVYFDENDFDDDENLDLDGSPTASNPTRNSTNVQRANSPIKVSEMRPPDQGTAILDIDPANDNPIPWSSSPPAHLLPPSTRRTIPWLEQPSGTGINDHGTPAPPKAPYPWNYTQSAVKEEQKE